MNADHVRILERVYQLFRTCPDPNRKEKGEGWSVKEIVGHLIDSAGNNHQRLLRYPPEGSLSFPGYDQEAFVRRAAYRDFDFLELLSLWYLYNRLLLHIIERIPAEDLEATIAVGDRPPIPIRQLVADYFSHMESHERQARSIIAS